MDPTVLNGFEIQQRAEGRNSSDKYSVSPEKLVLGAGAAYLLYNHIKNQQRPQQQNYYNGPPPGYGYPQPGPSYPYPSYPQPGYPQPGPSYPQTSYPQPTYVQPSRPSSTYTTQTSYPSTSFSSFPSTSGSFTSGRPITSGSFTSGRPVTSGSFTSGRPSFSNSYPSTSTTYYPQSNYGKTYENQGNIEGFAPPGISPVPIGYIPVVYTT